MCFIKWLSTEAAKACPICVRSQRHSPCHGRHCCSWPRHTVCPPGSSTSSSPPTALSYSRRRWRCPGHSACCWWSPHTVEKKKKQKDVYGQKVSLSVWMMCQVLSSNKSSQLCHNPRTHKWKYALKCRKVQLDPNQTSCQLLPQVFREYAGWKCQPQTEAGEWGQMQSASCVFV